MNRKEIHNVQETLRELIKRVEEDLKTPMLDDEDNAHLIGLLQGYQHGYELVRKLK
tara:strand:+ start:74 stop:241 length:168 start_codon:yes stop_codon:yes gene_type:complete